MGRIVLGNKELTKKFTPYTDGPNAGKRLDKITMGNKTLTLTTDTVLA